MKRTILYLAIVLSSFNLVKSQSEKKKTLVKLGTSGLTLDQVSKGDSVLYYVLYLENTVKLMDYEEIPNYSWINFYTKDDVVNWFDEAIDASYKLKEYPDKTIYGKEVIYTVRSGNTIISANYKPEEYFKCTTMLLERARKIFIKKTM
jgi:hypothetical protein